MTTLEEHPLQYEWNFTYFKKVANKSYEDSTFTLGTTRTVHTPGFPPIPVLAAPLLSHAPPRAARVARRPSAHARPSLRRSRTSGDCTSTCAARWTSDRRCAIITSSVWASSQCGRMSRMSTAA
eukprot:6495533-Prymnesium_polylepis.1